MIEGQMQGDRERLLVAAIPRRLNGLARSAAEPDGGIGLVVTDAVARLSALVAAGLPPAAEVADEPDFVVLEVTVPWWVVEQLDRSIGAAPGLNDRSSALAVALAAHLGAMGAIPSGPAEPAASRPRRLSGEVRKGDESRDYLGAAERAIRRLASLEGAAGRDGSQAEAVRDIAQHLMERGADMPQHREPESIAVGLRRENVAGITFAEPPSIRAGGDIPLSGLTNRVAPSLWAASQLAALQARRNGEGVPLAEFLAVAMPEAWSIGGALRLIDASSRRPAYAASARWPKVPAERQWPTPEEGLEPYLQWKIAQSAVGFIEYSLLSVPTASRERGRVVGPMAALGLASAWLDKGEVRVALNPPAADLLTRLGDLGVSCHYPHGFEAWAEYEDFLLEHARCGEALDQLRVLRLLQQASSRADFYQEASRSLLSAKQLERLRRREDAEKPVPGYSTVANGFVGRLREWGLVDLDQGVVGPKALTPDGREALARYGHLIPPMA